MHPNAERVRQALAAAGARADVVEFPDGTRTSADAAAAIGTTLAQIARTLVFLADGEPDAVRRATGFPIGGVPPVGHARGLRAVIDSALPEHEEIWSAGGTPNAVFPTTPDELIRLTGAEVVDVRA
jgi:prolyl-tRNA editing enzyme YbaK/EbsC (Cys-tRNA(Pro) deacylase)